MSVSDLNLDITLSDDEEEDEEKNNNESKQELSMRCAEITAAGEPLKITSRPSPQVPEEGVLVKTLYGGVCHSDIHYINDEVDLGQGNVFKHRDILGENFSGIVLGHEVCGTVHEIGKRVPANSINIGDTVIVYPWIGCRQCELCTGGNNNSCESNNHGTTDIGQGPISGGYGSFVAVPEVQYCIKLPKVIRPEIGCMLPCSALTAYEAILKAKPTLDSAIRMRGLANLLVIGLGGLGMWTVVLMKYVLCDKNVKVICADTKRSKLDMAGQLGADDVTEWDMDTETSQLVAATTVNGYNKIDAAINYVGSPRTMDIAFNSLYHGGTIVCIGIYGGSYSLSLPDLVNKGVSIQGSRVGRVECLRQLVELLAVQDIQTYPAIEIIDLDQINDVLERLKQGDVKGRAIIKHTE